jgi:hypothetical protein
MMVVERYQEKRTVSETMQQLIERFPGKEDRIRQLWTSDDDFRELGADYITCLEAQEGWSAESASSARFNAYKSLQRQLELEILSIVEQWGRKDPEYDYR